MAILSDIIEYLNKLVNPKLAYNWDNVGLQIGNGKKEINKILLTLDVTDNAIEKAIKTKSDLIISHHPLIFKPIKRITNPTYLKLIKNDIAVFVAHTNLDLIKGGVNTALANKLGLIDTTFISSENTPNLFHIAVYTPNENVEDLSNAVFEAGAGAIGNYSNCMNHYEVNGQFLPKENSNPTIGKIGKIEKLKEVKVEFFTDELNLDRVLRAMLKAHIYETPAYAVYPQSISNQDYGLGLIGKLKEETTIEEFCSFVKKQLNVPNIKLWKSNKSLNSKISKIAVCGGSGSSLINKVCGKADIFVSADFNYHSVLESRIPLIDAGHFYTEYPVLKNMEVFLENFDPGLKITNLSINEHEINSQVTI